MKTKYLITGAAGHLGITLVKQLCDNTKNVKVLIMPNDKNEIYLPTNIEKCYGDVTDKTSLIDFFTNNEDKLIVIHCAGIVSIASHYNQLVYNVNVLGTQNIVDLCIQNKVDKLIYVSSVHAIKELPKGQTIIETNCFNSDDVIGLYAKTKAEATKYVLNSVKKGLNVSIVHPSGITGPNDYGKGHITQLIIDYCRGTLSAGVKGGYDFVDVRDVAKGIILCIEKGKSGECYILSNKYITIKEIFQILHKITGHKEIKTFIPMWLAKSTSSLAELYYKILKQPPLYTKYSLYTLSTNAQFSNLKAQKELGYKNRNFEETLKDTVNFLKKEKRI
ncbi:MAG: NAD-dependent epimerase/dehydratase family protein [Bacilli bacterium]